MKKLLKQFEEALPTVLLALGAAAVSWGVGWICLPAGIITAGCFSMTAGWLLIRGEGGGGQ